jgi:membrane fusion protein, multidrug efflux system
MISDTNLAQTSSPEAYPDSRDAHEATGSRVAPFPSRGVDIRNRSDTADPWPGRIPWIVALLALAGAAVWLTVRYWPADAVPVPVEMPLQLAAVDVAVVEPRVLSASLPLSGSIGPVVQATVKSKVGAEVQTVTVREGQDVAAGDVIARLDTRNLQAQYDKELASVDKSRADLQLATLNRDKNRMLLQQGFISQNTFESTESAYAASAASLKLTEAQARLAKINLDDALIRAPFAGTVSKRLVQPGEKVSSDSAIVALVDLKQMLLEAAIPAADIPSVSVGQKARFKVGGFGERAFEGEVQRINPITADGSRAITVYVAVDNADGALKGGMFAQGSLLLHSGEPVLAIPRSAVRSEAATQVVYTLQDGKVVRRPVTLGPPVQGNTHIEVRAGLAAGERVIVADIGDRKPGAMAVVNEEVASR